MKHVRITIAMLACAVSAASAEEGPPSGAEEGKRKGGRDFGKFIEAADTNGDGAVSVEEFSVLDRISKLPEEKQAELFKRFDKNGDGLIRKEEMRRPRHGWGRRHPMPPLEKLDTDGDCTVSFEEFEKGEFAQRLPEERRKKFFKKLDRNNDGKLSVEDQPKGRGRPDRHRGDPDPKKLIGLLDRNDDEALNFEEFRQAPWLKDKGEDKQEDEFEKLDKSGDLLINKADFPPPPPMGPKGEGEGPPEKPE